MKILTWNVQWCRGIDGRVDPARIAAEVRRLGDADVVCLQEIADGYPEPRLAGSDGADQFRQLAALLPDRTALPAVAVDQPGENGARRRFGNMILSRLPVKQVYRWLLPLPCEPGVAGMPRIAIEAVIAAPFGDVRVITTHLEWYSALQRGAQVDELRRIYADGHAHARDGRRIMGVDKGPFETLVRPKATVICGDFNLEYDSDQHARMVAPFGDATPALANAWDLVHPGEPYPATFCIHAAMPGYGQLHCDFFFVDPQAGQRIADWQVDQDTQASDHQPVLLTLR
ncbi:MAG: endonuclease/exonuclease/phosphatase family protein [Burkholderiales bacterium]|nr:endonuclease/exonuclease/phosphatase family protein [Burkholderiales bacterium]GIK88002.1 MAG: endonuclease [Betaproteobacteria bacterium]